jgi:hypothetical protein
MLALDNEPLPSSIAIATLTEEALREMVARSDGDTGWSEEPRFSLNRAVWITLS